MAKDISPEEEVDDGIGRHEHDDEPSYRCTSTFAQRHKKKFMISIAAISFIAVVLVIIAVSTRSYSNDIDQDDVDIQIMGSSAMDINQSILSSTRQSSSKKCQQNEGLWNLILTTDDYPYETSWALHDGSNNNILAFGPPQGRKYEKQTRYIGTLCIPHGKYYMRWYDIMGDGICCTFGRGDWTMKLDGRVVFGGVEYSSNFGTQKDFQFDNKSSAKISMTNETGTFLIMPRPNDPVMCIELKDGFTNIPPTQEGRLVDQPYYGNELRRGEGAIFELHNLPLDFDYNKLGLISGVSQISLPTGSDAFLFGGIIDMKGNAPLVISTDDGQQYNDKEGDKSVLGIRVVASDASTTADEKTLYNSLFSNAVGTLSLASQMQACSFGKMNLVPFRTQGILGVHTVDLPSVSTTQGDAYMRNSITAALSSDLLSADFIIYCLPPGTYVAARPGEGIAYAYINHWLSVFDDEWCHSPSLLMHEIGHDMNLGHSNQGGQPYEDQTGIMGASFPNKNGPRTCFNAAKSWQLRWYKDKSIRINSSGSAPCFDGILHGIADYQIATTVLLKVQTMANDYYINFNAKKGINRGTQEAGNMVTVVSRPRGPRDSYAESDLVSKLNRGESYSLPGYTVSVEEIDINAGTAEVKVLPTGHDSCSVEK